MEKSSRKKGPSLLFRFRSIQTTMLFSFSVLIISALLTFFLFSLNHVKSTILKNSTDYTIQLIGQVNADINSYITYMENTAQIVVNNGDVKEYLFKQAGDITGNVEEYRIVSQLKTLKETRGDIHNIGVISKKDRYIINESDKNMNPYADLEMMDWYKPIISGEKKIILTASHIQNIVKDDYQWVVTLSQGIENPITNQVEGIFFVDLNYSSISDLCDRISLGSKGYVFIINEEGNIIYHPKQQLLYSGIRTERIDEVLAQETGSFLTKDGDTLYTVSKSEKTGWSVVGVSYIDEMMGQLKTTQLIYALLALLLFVIALAISVLLSNAFTKPIKELGNSMKEVELGHFDGVNLDTGYKNEIGDLTNSFQVMTTKIQNLMKQNIEEQRTKRESELRALQAQINPHFLYNTLDSIIWMSESGKNKEVVLMTSALSKLLRKSISSEQEVVSIESEINYTKEYLTIQKMRYQDKLEYEIDVDPEILSLLIIKLVLQPLVENAIYHGIKYKNGKGLIRITGKSTASEIILEVEDNGKGMDEETLSRILKQDSTNRKSVGVYNVHNRLQLYYGKNYGLLFISEPDKGTRARVVIPNVNRREKQGEEME